MSRERRFIDPNAVEVGEKVLAARERRKGTLIVGVIFIVILLVGTFAYYGRIPPQNTSLNGSGSPAAQVCAGQSLPDAQQSATIDAANPFGASVTVDSSSTTCGIYLDLKANGKTTKTVQLPYKKGAVNAGNFQYKSATLYLWACMDPNQPKLFYSDGNSRLFEGLNPGDALQTC